MWCFTLTIWKKWSPSIGTFLVSSNIASTRVVWCFTPDPKIEDHQLALTKGREGNAKIIAHIAWRVETPADVKEYYERFKALGVTIDHCVSHAYEEMGNTVSCYFLDPEGNRLEIYALIPERDEKRINRPLDLDQTLDKIVAQASGLPANAV